MRVSIILAMVLSIAAIAEEPKPADKVENAETTTILPCVLSQAACKPGFGVKITYRWDAKPLENDFGAWVHISNGKMTFQDDHALPAPTTKWSGRVEYENLVVTPVDAPLGEYKIIVGLWHPKTGSHPKLKAGEGVIDFGDTSYQVGILKLTEDAPVPPLPAPTLNLDGYKVTFDEDFNDKELSVSPWGPGTRWIAHTPSNMDFGDAGFANPEKDFPFTVDNGILRIEARKTGKRWRAGLLCSVDPKGQGFSQKYGYFEMRAKLPKGAGTWPAFWLCGAPALTDKKLTNIEIDVLEEYGVNSNVMHSTVHLWHPGGKHEAEGRHFIVPGMTDDFHKYGVMVTEENITIYFDGIEMFKTKTPEEGKVPIFPMVDLALGGGWPIDKTPNPSYMYVDYVRAYAK